MWLEKGLLERVGLFFADWLSIRGDRLKMTLGTGVFLSSALLGFILLFVVIKDRWNCRKIGIRLGIFVVVIPAAYSGLRQR